MYQLFEPVLFCLMMYGAIALMELSPTVSERRTIRLFVNFGNWRLLNFKCRMLICCRCEFEIGTVLKGLYCGASTPTAGQPQCTR